MQDNKNVCINTPFHPYKTHPFILKASRSHHQRPTSYYAVENRCADELSDDDSDDDVLLSVDGQPQRTFNALHSSESIRGRSKDTVESKRNATSTSIDRSNSNHNNRNNSTSSSVNSDTQKEKEPSMLEILSAPDVARPLFMGVMLMNFQQFSGVNTVIFYSGNHRF